MPRDSDLNNSDANILIVDDDEDILVAGKLLLKRHFKSVSLANRPNLVPKMMESKKHDVVLLDMNFDAGDTSGRQGLIWLEKIRKIDPDIIIILITAHSAVDIAVEAMKLGAIDFVEKPWQNEKLLATIRTAVALRKSRDENQELKSRNNILATELSRAGQEILGTSAAMERVHRLIEKSAPSDANVLILGENGTGKELVAKEIHRLSNRSSQIFMTVDMGAIAETLIESELFGHKKGAFTDSREDRIGRFQAANGGTLFLDEIGNIPLHMQTKLLSVLEQRQVTPVGANSPIDFDVRIISATNMPNAQLSDETYFRFDLRFRLNTVEIDLPPLRERGGDIAILTKAFIEQYARKYNSQVTGITNEAMSLLKSNSWAGNVRALRHAVERAIVLSDSQMLEASDFSLSAQHGDELLNISGNESGKTLEELELLAIDKALKNAHGNISHAAKSLGITRSSLYRRMEKHGL